MYPSYWTSPLSSKVALTRMPVTPSAAGKVNSMSWFPAASVVDRRPTPGTSASARNQLASSDGELPYPVRTFAAALTALQSPLALVQPVAYVLSLASSGWGYAGSVGSALAGR